MLLARKKLINRTEEEEAQLLIMPFGDLLPTPPGFPEAMR